MRAEKFRSGYLIEIFLMFCAKHEYTETFHKAKTIV